MRFADEFKRRATERGFAYDRAHLALVEMFDEALQALSERVEAVRGKVFRELVEAVEDAATGTRDKRQVLVLRWAVGAFGADQATSLVQRGARLLEEACEAFQAAGGDADLARKVVEHVFSRPPGDLPQELGGVGITLLALAQAANASADGEELRELGRILSLPQEHFTKRNAAKNAAGLVAADIAKKDG